MPRRLIVAPLNLKKKRNKLEKLKVCICITLCVFVIGGRANLFLKGISLNKALFGTYYAESSGLV